MDRMAWRSMRLAALGSCVVLAFYYFTNVSIGLYMEVLTCFNACIFLLYMRYFKAHEVISQRALTIINFICFLSLINVSSIFSIFSFENYMSGDKSIHNFEYKKLVNIVFNFVTFIFAVRFLIWSIKPQADKAYSADGGLVSLRALYPDGVWAVTMQGYRGHLPELGEVELVAEGSGWRGVCEGAVVEGCFSAPNALMQLAHIRGNTRAVSA